MNGRRLVVIAITLLVLGLAPPPGQASAPASLWIARSPGGTAAPVATPGIRVRDRFPDALVLDDAAAAKRFADRGERVDGPFAVGDASRVFLLRAKGSGAPFVGADGALHACGLALLWENGRDYLVVAENGLPDVLPGHLRGKRLSPTALPPDAVRPPDGAETAAVVFNPLIDTLVAQVDSTRYFPWISRLAGAQAVLVGGASTTFTTRSSYTTQCRTAEQYVRERFLAMGFTDVVYDPFQIGSTTARNVVATLPGVTTPERIYVVGGHLDSTSPNASTNARGANDNASGTAAVLAIAELLKDYAFDSTIQFVAFTGEEQGLYGSTHYAAAAVANGDDIRGAVTCDMIAWYGSNYRIDIEGRTFADPIMQVMKDACNAYTGLATTVTYFAWGSDHVPFLDRNIPAFLAIESDYDAYPCYHRTCDTADQNIAAFGVEVTRACLATVAHLAGIQAPLGTGVPLAERSLVSLSARPNPFRGDTTLRFSLPEPGRVRLSIYDVRGRLIRTLTDGGWPAGSHAVRWDGRSGRNGAGGNGAVPGGIYFVRLESAAGRSTTRAVRLP